MAETAKSATDRTASMAILGTSTLPRFATMAWNNACTDAAGLDKRVVAVERWWILERTCKIRDSMAKCGVVKA